MVDDSGGRRPFVAGLNGRRWPHWPFRPRPKHPTQSQVANSNWVGRLSLGLNGRRPFRPTPNGRRPPETGSNLKPLQRHVSNTTNIDKELLA